MKKTGLFKIITFVLLGIIPLTWLFSASYFQNGELVELGMYQLGFFDFFQLSNILPPDYVISFLHLNIPPENTDTHKW